MDLSNPVTQQMMGGVIRSILVAGGGAGIFSGDQLGIVAGSLAALIGVAWSLYQKRAAATDKHVTVAAAVHATVANPQNATNIIAAAKAGTL
jgi:hypothetical protein